MASLAPIMFQSGLLHSDRSSAKPGIARYIQSSLQPPEFTPHEG